MQQVKEQTLMLKSRRVILRPMIESDRDSLQNWHNDLEFRYYDAGDEAAGYTLEQLQQTYQGGYEGRFYFIIEAEGKPVGGCWFQRTDLERILEDFPNLDCRRIGLYIGETELRGRGIGTKVVRLLTQFGFEEENADMIFACDVPKEDIRCRRVFEKNGYLVCRENPPSEGAKAGVTYDLMLMRETYDDFQID